MKLVHDNSEEAVTKNDCQNVVNIFLFKHKTYCVKTFSINIILSLSVKTYMLWLFFEGIVLSEVKVTGF